MRLPSVSHAQSWVLARIERLWSTLAPRRQASEIAAVAVDAVRSRRELVLENAVLRHQVNVLRRSCKRPRLDAVDRLKLLLGARWLPSWRRVIVLVQPETVLRWHRAGFRRFWRHRSRSRKASPLPRETIELIRDMATRGRLWGAERIRGELLKLGIKVSKRTIQKYMRGVRGRRGGGQSWATFVKNHAERMWACDFIQTHDLLFRQVYAFFIVHRHRGGWSTLPRRAIRPRRGRRSSCATPRWTGTRRPCWCGIATTSSVRHSIVRHRASARR